MNINDPLFNPFTKNDKFELYSISDIHNTILKYGKMMEFGSNVNIYKYIESHFFYIDSGRIRIVFIDFDGNEHILNIFTKDNHIGVKALLTNDTKYGNNMLITECPTKIYRIDKKTFFYLIDNDKNFKYYILTTLASDSYQNIEKRISLTTKSCKRKLYELLVSSVNENSVSSTGWYNLKFQYSQNDMAKIISTSKTSISQAISELYKEELVRTINNNIEVKIIDNI